METTWDQVPCGLMKVDDNGRVCAANVCLMRLYGCEGREGLPAFVDELLSPASRLYHQLTLGPMLRLSGRVEEVYLEFLDVAGKIYPALVNVRREEGAGHSIWSVMRIEQRGRWESAIAEARRRAERQSEELARQSEELAASKQVLERTLKELHDTHWLLHKVAAVLPVCMYCRRVKSDDGANWEEAIEFLKHHGSFLSHGCCPGCVDRMRRDFHLPPVTPAS